MPAVQTAHKPNWRKWWAAGFGRELLPIIPPGATLSPNSKVKPESRGKVPGLKLKNADGYWVGLVGKWAEKLFPTAERLQEWAKMGAGIGIQGRLFNCADVDVNDPAIANALVEIVVGICGNAPMRYRDGSPRVALMYRIADADAAVIRKWRIAFNDAGGHEHAFEWLGHGRYWNVDGLHPSGAPYKWSDPHPCELGIDNITVVTAEQVWKVRDAILEYVDMMGFTLKASKDGSGSPDAKSLDDASLHAPTPQLVLDALKHLKNTPENFETHDDFVLALRAIKAALGKHSEEHYGDVLEWALEYEGNTEEYIRGRWESIDDSSIGWEWLAARAHAHGFSGDAQRDFADNPQLVNEPSENKPQPVSAAAENRTGAEIPKIEGPETACERALKRYIWCAGLGQFYDTLTGEYMDKDSFNSMETDVADYGRSGIQSAAGIFLNSQGARKVHSAAYIVGGPLVVKEGATLKLNLWRPNLDFTPATNVSDDDVKPWLDHLQLMFGESVALRHLLDVLSFWVQKPGQKVNHALVIYGATQGTGKDSCFAPIMRFLGKHNVKPITPEMINSQFNDFLCAQLCVYTEMIQIEKKATQNKMKPWMAVPFDTLLINRKFAQPFIIDNTVNNLIYTNYPDAINLDDTDRRYCVLEVELMTPMPQSYYRALWDWYNDGGFEKVVGWLMRRDISAFDPFAPPPMTDAKREMINLSMSMPARWVCDQFSEGERYAHRKIVTLSEPVKAARDYNSGAPRGVNYKSTAVALKTKGFIKAQRIDINGDRRQLWVRDPSGLLIKLSADQIRERYLLELNGSTMGKAA